MLAENCCYWRHVMQIQNMVDKGVFGELTFAECGYVHDCRFINFKPDGELPSAAVAQVICHAIEHPESA